MRLSTALGVMLLVPFILPVRALADPTNLLKSKTLRCEYPEGSFRMWQHGKLLEAEPDKITGAVHFDSIDRVNHSARKIGNAGASDVRLEFGPNALTFVEPIPQGGVHVTTVFAVTGGTDPQGFQWVPSVTSLHTPIREHGVAVVAVSYGRCALLLTP